MVYDLLLDARGLDVAPKDPAGPGRAEDRDVPAEKDVLNPFCESMVGAAGVCGPW
jgi:hypothetical protein